MYKVKSSVLVCLFLLGCSHPSHAVDRGAASQEPAQVSFEEAQKLTDPNYGLGTVRHIVAFKFGREVTKVQINEVIRKFMALKNISKRNGKPYILSIEAGSANSFEGADQGMQVGFIVSFKSEGDRNYYVGQPLIEEKFAELFDAKHLEFKKFVGPLLDTPVVPNGVFVFDFNVQYRAP